MTSSVPAPPAHPPSWRGLPRVVSLPLFRALQRKGEFSASGGRCYLGGTVWRRSASGACCVFPPAFRAPAAAGFVCVLLPCL